MNSITRRLGIPFLLSVGGFGCTIVPESIAADPNAVVVYDGGVFSNGIRRKIRNSENPEKYFELGRIDPGSAVTANLTRLNVTPKAGNFSFEVQFSTDGTTYTTPTATGSCGVAISSTDYTQKTCTSTSAGTDRYARIRVIAGSGADGEFLLSENHVPPLDATRHSHYGTDTINVTTWAENGNEDDRRFVRIGGTEGSPVFAGALQFQRVVVTITRYSSVVALDRLNGLKLKATTQTPDVEIADFGCPMDANGDYLWTSNSITCTLESAPRDGEIRIPLSRPDNPAGGVNTNATVVITRSSPNTAGTSSVRTDLTATIGN